MRRRLQCLILAAVTASAASAYAAPDAGAAPPPTPSKASIQKDVASLGACSEMTDDACPALARVIAAGDAAIPALKTRLAAGDDASKVRAAAALGLIGTPATLPPLIGALKGAAGTDVLVGVATAIARAGQSAPDAALQPLLELLASDELQDKLAAITALMMLRAPGSVEPLIGALAHFHPNVQASAASALGVLSDPRAAEALANMLSDTRTVWTVRVAVMEALGRIGERWTAGAVEPMLAHPRPEVRRAAALALGDLGAVWVAPALLRALSDLETAGEAALGVGKLGYRPAVRALVRAAEDEALPAEAQTQVMWAIGALGDVGVLPDLERLIQGHDDRLLYLTAEAMGRIGRPEAADALLALLDSKDKDVRDIAVWALEAVSGERLGADAEAWQRWLAERDVPRDGTP